MIVFHLQNACLHAFFNFSYRHPFASPTPANARFVTPTRVGNCHQILPRSYTPQMNIPTVMVFHWLLVMTPLSIIVFSFKTIQLRYTRHGLTEILANTRHGFHQPSTIGPPLYWYLPNSFSTEDRSTIFGMISDFNTSTDAHDDLIVLRLTCRNFNLPSLLMYLLCHDLSPPQHHLPSFDNVLSLFFFHWMPPMLDN